MCPSGLSWQLQAQALLRLSSAPTNVTAHLRNMRGAAARTYKGVAERPSEFQFATHSGAAPGIGNGHKRQGWRFLGSCTGAVLCFPLDPSSRGSCGATDSIGPFDVWAAAAPEAAAACMDTAGTSPPFLATSPGKALLASHCDQEPGFEDRCCCNSSLMVAPAWQALPSPGSTPLAPPPHSLSSNNTSTTLWLPLFNGSRWPQGRGHRLALSATSVPWPSQLQLVGHGLPPQPSQQVVGCQHCHGAPGGVRGTPDVWQDHCGDREGHCSPSRLHTRPTAPFRAVRHSIHVEVVCVLVNM